MELGEFPYFEDNLAVRLSGQGSQVRRLESIDDIVHLGGSAHLFLEPMTGRRTVADIIDVVTARTGEQRSTIAADFGELLVGLERRGLIASSHEAVEGRAYPYLAIVASGLRSTIHVDVTHRCNEKCVHCLVPRDNKQLAVDDVRSLMTQAAHLGFTGLAFSGGEPTLHPDFWEILQESRDLGFYFTVFTNGLTFNDEGATRLGAYRPEKVRISVYSMTPQVHDGITMVSGSFEKTMRTIMALKAAGVRIFINSPVMNRNYDGFEAIAEFCREHGFERSFDPVIQPTRDRTDLHQELQLTYDQAKKVTGFQQDAAELVVNVQPGAPVCNVGDDPSVDAGFILYPCPGLRLPLGCLHERSLVDLLDLLVLEELRSLSLDNLEVCQKCGIRDGCYRCHGHPFQEHGDYRRCATMDHRQARIRRELMVGRGTRTALRRCDG